MMRATDLALLALGDVQGFCETHGISFLERSDAKQLGSRFLMRVVQGRERRLRIIDDKMTLPQAVQRALLDATLGEKTFEEFYATQRESGRPIARHRHRILAEFAAELRAFFADVCLPASNDQDAVAGGATRVDRTPISKAVNRPAAPAPEPGRRSITVQQWRDGTLCAIGSFELEVERVAAYSSASQDQGPLRPHNILAVMFNDDLWPLDPDGQTLTLPEPDVVQSLRMTSATDNARKGVENHGS